MSKKNVSTETPEPPAELSSGARVIWAKKIRELATLGLLDDIDPAALIVFCNSVALYAEISGRRSLSKRDHRTLQHHSRLILRSAEQLGFTPSARARLIARKYVVSTETVKQNGPRPHLQTSKRFNQ